jgi:hypothetical protein
MQKKMFRIMTMKLTLGATGADKFLVNIAREPASLGAESVLTKRALVKVGAYERLEMPAEREKVAAMTLGELLYYVLIGEGKVIDEPA